MSGCHRDNNDKPDRNSKIRNGKPTRDDKLCILWFELHKQERQESSTRAIYAKQNMKIVCKRAKNKSQIDSNKC